MAWISELAGKAESLLNKLDSEAASVLTVDKTLTKTAIDTESKNVSPNKLDLETHGSVTSLPNSSSVPGSLQAYFGSLSSRGSPSALNKWSKSSPSSRGGSASASATPSHSRNASLENYLNFSSESANNLSTKSGVWSPSKVVVLAADNHSNHSRQSSLSSVPSLPTSGITRLDDGNIEPTQPFTNINIESSASSVSSSGSGVSAQLDSYVTLEHKDLDTINTTASRSLGDISEVDLLKKEVQSLNQEIKQLVGKSTSLHSELQAAKSAPNSMAEQLSAMQKNLREVQHREMLLQDEAVERSKELKALELRLKDKEEELWARNKELERCRLENLRLCEGASVSSERHSTTLQTASAQLEEAEALLRQEQLQRRTDQQNYSDRLRVVEEERDALAGQVRAAAEKLLQVQQAQEVHQAQVSALRSEATAAREELESYKAKARHILSSKEALIEALKKGSGDSTGLHADPNYSLLDTELKQTRAELSLCRSELERSGAELSRLRSELSELERCAEQEAARHSSALSDAHEQLVQLGQLKDELEQENRQARQEARCLQEELTREKVRHAAFVQEAQLQQDSLRRQSPKHGGEGVEELQRRVQSLTESLLQKQSQVDGLNTELQVRSMQLARLQQQQHQQESHLPVGRDAPLSIPMDDLRSRAVPTLLVESPFDGGVTRRVKRAYSSLDRFSVSLGLFLRRYPVARIIVLLYMLLLHLWVLIVLLTYSPEIHHTGYQPDGAGEPRLNPLPHK
ncbi:golgin subfamily A member 5 isoform X2 [Hyalella azteca]|uniref:Golgin subfamily A member 5 isoform X2 n=1 Tax=Hyalella azteca TaxID=294128 RepID=A0A979FSH4_HYAAZ|nr:golgin subfamily A member 5 isoform X2 [Hyalella azteca]